METLGTRLKRLRLESRLTQEQVADSIYVSSQAVGLYENDSRQPTSENVVRLASLFHVSTDYLLGIESGQIIDAKGLTEKECNLISELVAEISETNEKLKEKTE